MKAVRMNEAEIEVTYCAFHPILGACGHQHESALEAHRCSRLRLTMYSCEAHGGLLQKAVCPKCPKMPTQDERNEAERARKVLPLPAEMHTISFNDSLHTIHVVDGFGSERPLNLTEYRRLAEEIMACRQKR